MRSTESSTRHGDIDCIIDLVSVRFEIQRHQVVRESEYPEERAMDLLKKASETWRNWLIEDPFPSIRINQLAGSRNGHGIDCEIAAWRSVSNVTAGSACTTKPVWPLCVFRSVRASAISVWLFGCKNTGKSCPICWKPSSSNVSGVVPTVDEINIFRSQSK